jgi:ribosome assembly protein YihI (activator of Der GTPase)
MKNPSLRQEPRYAPASVIALEQKTSLLEWLEANNRIIYREKQDDMDDMSDDQDISELMDDDGFEDDDTDDLEDAD